MGQFGIYQNKNALTRKAYPYLIDVQSSLLESLGTRLVVPMTEKAHFSDKIIKELNPTIMIGGTEYTALVQQMAAIKKENMGKAIGECMNERQALLSAVDFLITGF